jgi:DNA ligase-associated metallophosphoesterase
MDSTGIVISLLNQTLTLLPQRAIFWREEEILFLSDLHWGKTEVFHQAGIPVPFGVLKEDLHRLTSAISASQAKRVIILGDLIHHVRGISHEVDEVVRQWRRVNSLPMELIEGNHDRGIAKFMSNWEIELVPREKSIGPFVFRHALGAKTEKYIWAGHLHPTVRLAQGLRFPCFEVGNRQGCLPAFSLFTGGQNIHRQLGSRYFAVVDQTVLEV